MSKIHQFHATFAACYGLFLCGLLFVWPSYTASLYADKETTLLSAPMTHYEISLIGCIPSLGAMLGTSVSGKIINFFGRHKGGMIITLPYLLSWTIVNLTHSSLVVIIARFIGGFSSGCFLVYGPIFISEIAEQSIRGFLLSGITVFFCIGSITSYIFGWVLTYRYIIWANMALTCIGLIIMMMVTESPVWLLKQKRETEACLALARYRGTAPDSKIVLEEMSRLKAQITPAVTSPLITGENPTTEKAEKEKLKEDDENTELQEKIPSYKIILTSRSTRRIFVIAGMALSLQVLMGLSVVQVYAKEIFSNAVPSLSPHLCSVMQASVLLFGALTSATFTDRFGRRILLIISAVLTSLCLFSMGLLIQTNMLPPWVTAFIILVYCYVFKLGSGNIPYVLLAEVFIPEVQSTATTILIEWMWLVGFIQLGVFPYIKNFLGVHGAFYCYSVFGILEALVGIFLLPETKGLTNAQIQEAFLRRTKGVVN